MPAMPSQKADARSRPHARGPRPGFALARHAHAAPERRESHERPADLRHLPVPHPEAAARKQSEAESQHGQSHPPRPLQESPGHAQAPPVGDLRREHDALRQPVRLRRVLLRRV